MDTNIKNALIIIDTLVAALHNVRASVDVDAVPPLVRMGVDVALTRTKRYLDTLTKKPTFDDPPEAFREFAAEALKGLDTDQTLVGILDDPADMLAEAAMAMRIGMCLLREMAIVLAIPHGGKLPPKLMSVVDAIAWYDPENPVSLHEAMKTAVESVGVIPVKH